MRFGQARLGTWVDGNSSTVRFRHCVGSGEVGMLLVDLCAWAGRCAGVAPWGGFLLVRKQSVFAGGGLGRKNKQGGVDRPPGGLAYAGVCARSVRAWRARPFELYIFILQIRLQTSCKK